MLLLRSYGLDEPLAQLARYAGVFPAQYDADERIDLGPYLMVEHPQDCEAVASWLAQVLPELLGGGLEVLVALATTIHGAIRYARR